MIRTLAFVVGGSITLLVAAFDAGWPPVPCAVIGTLGGYLLAQYIDD